VTWGADQGADARRLLAIVCRRGGIRGIEVGAIRVGTWSSTVDVAAEVAERFAVAVAVADPREPNVVIAPDRAPPGPEAQRPPRSEPRSPTPEPRSPTPEPHYKGASHRPAARKPTWSKPDASRGAFKGDAYKPSARTGAEPPRGHAPRSTPRDRPDDKPSGYKGKRPLAPSARGHGPPKRSKP